MPAPIAVERITNVVEEYLDGEGYEFVDLKIGGNVSRPVIEVYADIEGGITSEDCATLARGLRYRLEVEGLFNDLMTLIVSSPGLNRVIKKEKDFSRFSGRRVKISLEESINGRGKLNGILKGYQDGTVLVTDTEEGDIALAPGRWKEIRLVPEYPEGFK